MTNKVTYAGIDVHDETLVAAWRKARERESWTVVDNNDEGRQQLAREIGPGEVWAVYETSGSGFVLHDQLTAMGWRVDVLATTKLPKSTRSRKRKTDLEDARRLLDVLVAHGEGGTELPNVWIPPRATREDREISRHRLKLGDVVGHVRTQIKCLLKRHALKYPGTEKTSWTVKYQQWLRDVTKDPNVASEVKVILASHLRMLESAEAERDLMSAEVERLSQEPAYERQAEELTKIPGVGVLTAMVFLLEMGDVRRFQNRKQVGSYLGLTPNSYESGQNDDRKGHISRMGPPRIRKVLNQAAWAFIRVLADEKRWYQQLKYRKGTKKAIVALMRRLGIVMWHRAREVA